MIELTNPDDTPATFSHMMANTVCAGVDLSTYIAPIIEYCPQCGKVKQIKYGTGPASFYTSEWCQCPYNPPLTTATAYMPLAPSDLEAIRTMIREEVDKALKNVVRQLRMNGGPR